MCKAIKVVISVVLFTLISGCTSLNELKTSRSGTAEWDFDHNVQFRQTKLAEKKFQLEVVPNNNVPFERLASFLIRKSYSLCGGYHYKLEMIKGIEEFNDKLAMPHYIFSSLTAKVEC